MERPDYLGPVVHFALAAIAIFLIGVLPGAAVHALMRPSVIGDPVLWFAASPAISLGSLFVVAQALDLVGLPLMPWQPIFVVGVLAIGGVARVRRARIRSSLGASKAGSIDRRPPSATTTSLVLLVIGTVVGLAAWVEALRGQPDGPPSRDGLYHGFFVKRIVDAGTIDYTSVLVTDPVTEDIAATFYPSRCTMPPRCSISCSESILGSYSLPGRSRSAAVFLPVGLFVLVRRFVPDRPDAAGFTALVVPFFAMFPYRPAAWSAITLVVAMALIPVVLVLVGKAADAEERRLESVAPASLALFGVICTHTSQLALLFVLVAVIEGEAIWRNRHGLAAIRCRAVNLLFVCGIVMALYMPSVLRLTSAASERQAFAETGYLRFTEAIGTILDFSFAMPGTQAALGGLVVFGVWMAARDRALGAWTVCLLATVTLFLATAVSSGFWRILRPITQPWYYSAWRTSYQIALVAAVFAGYALARVASGLNRALRGCLPRSGGSIGPVVVAAAFVGLGITTLIHQPVDIVRNAYDANARTKPSMKHTFDYLTEHVASDEVVLNEERDGSAWMYASSGLRPLLAVYQYLPTTQTEDRLYLATHIADVGEDGRVRELIARWGIRFVMVSDTGFVDEPPRVDANDLIDNPAFEEVFTEGGIRIFRLLD